jgi:hypothetical protein
MHIYRGVHCPRRDWYGVRSVDKTPAKAGCKLYKDALMVTTADVRPFLVSASWSADE